MRKTQNINLNLYDQSDIFNITGSQNSLNSNFEIIDEEINAINNTNSIDEVKNDVASLKEETDKITEEIYYTSTNLYNSALQTNDTISPHYFVSGVPYNDTRFDTAYNCTAPIVIDPDTEYTLAIVPDKNGVSIPWGNAENGVFFYNNSGKYISSTKKKILKHQLMRQHYVSIMLLYRV